MLHLLSNASLILLVIAVGPSTAKTISFAVLGVVLIEAINLVDDSPKRFADCAKNTDGPILRQCGLTCCS